MSTQAIFTISVGANTVDAHPMHACNTQPIDHASSLWLENAATQLGVPASLAREFARNAVLALPGLTLQLSLWQPQPVAQWVALGLLPRPAHCSPSVWSELLLRANCAVSAMNTVSLALSEQGDGLLVLRLASRPGAEHHGLADELAQLMAIAESLVAGATALATPISQASSAPTTPPTAFQPDTSTLNLDWHSPLLRRALQHLGIAAPTLIQTVGMIVANARTFEIIADSDQRHLLVSTAIDTPLMTPTQREQALQANLQLLLLTHCAVVLAPHGSTLQARWNSQGLAGEDFADWLLDFGQLADRFTSQPLPAASAPRNPA